MNPARQIPASASPAQPALLDRAKQLASTLLSERGEASGAKVSRELNEVLRALDAADRHDFQGHLAAEFQPDKTALRLAADKKTVQGKVHFVLPVRIGEVKVVTGVDDRAVMDAIEVAL